MSYLCAGCENRLHSAKSSELAFALICTIFAYIVKAGRARRNKWNSVLLPLLAWTLQFYGTMKTIREIYRIGYGPSSSHTMGPRKASEIFLNRHPEAVAFEVILYGSLAATGKGHLTDVAILDTLQPHAPVEIVWKPSVFLSFHPNGMTFRSKNSSGEVTDEWTVFSVGGGALAEEGKPFDKTPELYEMNSMTQILSWCERTGRSYWEYVQECEDHDIWDYLAEVWSTMREAIERGLDQEGVLPGPLNLRRKASSYYIKAKGYKDSLKSRGLVFAYAFHQDIVLDSNIIKSNIKLQDVLDALDTVVLQNEMIDVISIALPGVMVEGNVYSGIIEGGNHQLKERLEKRYEKEIYLINDVNAAVVGYYASQNEYKSLAFLFQPIGRMAGSGIVVNGQLVRGMDHLAGEVALLPLNLSDAYLTLANTPEGTLELVTKNIMSIIAIVAPEAIVVYSDLILDSQDVSDEIKKALSQYPLKVYPQIIKVENILEYILLGAMILSAKE